MKNGIGASAWTRRALVAIAIAFGMSCTRMPTAPRIQITVEGRITGPSGEPLRDAYVSFLPGESVWTGWDAARTDSFGLYSVTLLSGKYTVSVQPPYGYGAPIHEARVAFSSAKSRYDFRFHGFRVTGRLTGPTGAPIDSGSVSAEGPAAPHGGVRAPLKNASYSFLLPAGIYSFYASDADHLSGLAGRSISGVAITADTTIDIELTGVPVSGHVYGPDGLPMDSIAVGITYLATNLTKPDGSYQLYVPPGTYQVLFVPPYPRYIFPRVTDPVVISGPTTIDGDLSGVEWTGTVRRTGTGEPAADVRIIVTQAGDELYLSAAIKSGPQGEFRFVLEPGHAYDLETYDSTALYWTTRLHDVAATADTTFDILVP